jgi:hypothetical protein
MNDMRTLEELFPEYLIGLKVRVYPKDEYGMWDKDADTEGIIIEIDDLYHNPIIVEFEGDHEYCFHRSEVFILLEFE